MGLGARYFLEEIAGLEIDRVWVLLPVKRTLLITLNTSLPITLDTSLLNYTLIPLHLFIFRLQALLATS